MSGTKVPDFKPEGVHDYYRAQWQRINRAHDVDPQPCELKIISDVSEGQIGHTNWVRISSDQARRILAMLSTESETN